MECICREFTCSMCTYLYALAKSYFVYRGCGMAILKWFLRMFKLDATPVNTIMALEEFFTFPYLDVLFLYFNPWRASDCKSSFIAVQEGASRAKCFWHCFCWPCSICCSGEFLAAKHRFVLFFSYYSWWPRALHVFSCQPVWHLFYKRGMK